MLSALFLVVLLLVFFAFAFGATRLFLKHTVFEEYTLEASFLLGPPLLILVFSLGGYVVPTAISRWLAWAVLGLGIGLSIAVAVYDWRAIQAQLRKTWRRSLLLLAGAGWAATVLFLYFPANIWSSFFFLGNGEYINYAELAGLLTGQCVPTAELPFPRSLVNHPKIRIGQDIIAACTALVAGKHPINVVLPLSILYRFQYSLALGLLLQGLVKGRCRVWLLPLLLFLDGCLLVETFSFSTSWMSSNCTVGMYVVCLAVLAMNDGRYTWRVVAMLVLANVYFLITYPEFLAVFKVFELALLLAWWARGQRNCWQPIVLVSFLVCLLHPLMVFQKMLIVHAQSTGPAGWNIIGDPWESPLSYAGHLLGLRYAHVPLDPFADFPWLTSLVALAVGTLLVAGLGVLAWKGRYRMLVGCWIGLVLFFHIMPALREGQNYYGALKLVTQTYFVVLLALAALCNCKPRLVRYGACVVVVFWTALAGSATAQVFAVVEEHGTAYDYVALRKSLALNRASGEAVAGRVPQILLYLLHFAADECGLPLVPLTDEQYAFLQRGNARHHRVAPAPGNCELFRGLLIVHDDNALAEIGTIQLQLHQRLAVVERATVYQGRVVIASRIDFPPDHWLIPDSPPLPPVFVADRHLVIRGEIPTWAEVAMPCRFQVIARDLKWQQDALVTAPGPFEIRLELPAEFVGSTVAFTLVPGQTFRPRDLNPASSDDRVLSFLLRSVDTERRPLHDSDD